ncbi:MAG: dienelactone hydrolase family protein, partial [Acidobacteriaceae bacterium]
MKVRLPQASSLTVASLLCLTFLPAHAQDWAKARLESSPRHREYVTLHHDARAVQALVVYPEV